VKSATTEEFWDLYRQLPAEERERARRAYRLWRENPQHGSLRFRRVSTVHPIYSVRVGLSYRALGLLDGETVTWYWIGPHAEYDRLLRG
jgi:hypothetical protein